jgi:hypothetical protein
MKGFVYVAPDGFESDERLKWWVAQAVSFARGIAKTPKQPRRPQEAKFRPRRS